MRRRKRSIVAWIRSFRLCIAFVAVTVIAAAIFLSLWPGFWPKEISVTGNRRVSSTDILARARIAPHLSIWIENNGAIRRRIEGIPYVLTASIHRVPPSSVRIRIRERTPFAVLRSGFDSVLVDRSLRVLAPATPGEMPLEFVLRPGSSFSLGEFVTDGRAVAMRSAYDTMRQRGLSPARLNFDRFGGLTATLRDGVQLLLGRADDLPEKLGLVSAVMVQLNHGQRRVAAIDVRAPATPVVVYR